MASVNDLVSISISFQKSLQDFQTQKKQPTAQDTPPADTPPPSDAVQVSISTGGAAPTDGPPRFRGRRDGDGGLGRLERQKQNFDNIDANSDGSLSLDELKSAQASRQADGRKTPFLDRLINNFSQSDTDQSGGISFAEAHPKEAAFVKQLFGFSDSAPAPQPQAAAQPAATDQAAAPASGDAAKVNVQV